MSTSSTLLDADHVLKNGLRLSRPLLKTPLGRYTKEGQAQLLRNTGPDLLTLEDQAALYALVSLSNPELIAVLAEQWQTRRKVAGHTVLVIDVSGSMNIGLTLGSMPRRYHLAMAVAVAAREVCERLTLYVTSGNDQRVKHETVLLPPELRGYELVRALNDARMSSNGGGIFVRQVLEHLERQPFPTPPDRIVLLGDNEDIGGGLQDYVPTTPTYYFDVSGMAVDQEGVWTTPLSSDAASLIALFNGPQLPLFALEKNGRPLTGAVEF